LPLYRQCSSIRSAITLCASISIELADQKEETLRVWERRVSLKDGDFGGLGARHPRLTVGLAS
jgi:hypothetical protein